MRRGVLVGGVVVVVIAAAGGGWLAGRNIKSPAELAAEAEPPQPSLITVAVERLELSAEVITRADIGYDEPASLTLAGSLGGQPTTLIVTSIASEGSDLAEGSVAVEVSGRPVFVLEGEIPVFRDLRPGATGVDVLQLEEALARLGYLEVDPDDTWDDATGQAVTAWYEAAGYPVNALSDAEQAALEAARNRVRAAGDAVTNAAETLDEAREGPTATQLLTAESAVKSAEEQLRFAQIDETRSAADADLAIRSAETQRDQAARDYALAESRWQSAQSGVHPDTGTLPTPLELETLRLAVSTAEQVLRQADRAVVDARTARDIAAVQSAAAVRSGNDQLALARASLEELLAPPDVSAISDQLRSAQEELSAARGDLADLQEELGVWVPAGELLFLKRMPVRVDRLPVSRGSRLDGSFMTVTGSDLAIRGAVSTRDATLVAEGMTVLIDDRSLPAPIEGTIRLVEDRAGTRGVSPDRHYIEIVAEGIPDELIGSNVRVVIPVNTTAGEILAVPAAALSATADGSSRVQVEAADGSTRFVTVEPGLAAAGLVEITPIDGELAEGDRVVVGFTQGE